MPLTGTVFRCDDNQQNPTVTGEVNIRLLYNAATATTNTTLPFGTAAATFLLNPHSGTQVTDSAGARPNYGWMMNGDDSVLPGMTSTSSVKRRIPAGTWTFAGSATCTLALSNYTQRVYVYRVATGGGSRTQLMTGNSATFTPSALGVSWSITLTSQPEFVFEPGESLLISFTCQKNSAGLTGESVTFPTAGDNTGLRVTLPSPGLRYQYIDTGRSDAVPYVGTNQPKQVIPSPKVATAVFVAAYARSLSLIRDRSASVVYLAAYARQFVGSRSFTTPVAYVAAYARALVFTRVRSSTVTYVAAFARQVTYLREYASTVTYVAAFARTISLAKEFASSVTYVAVYARQLIFSREFASLAAYLATLQPFSIILAAKNAVVTYLAFNRPKTLIRAPRVATVTYVATIARQLYKVVLATVTYVGTYARQLIYARQRSAAVAYLASMRVDISQAILNRMTGGGGGTTVFKRWFIGGGGDD